MHSNDLIKTLATTTNEEIIDLEPAKSGTYLLVKGEVRTEGGRHLHLKKLEVYGETPVTPVFLKELYTFGLGVYAPVGTVVGHVEAIDYQQDSLTYSIEGDAPFLVDEKGQITLKALVNHNAIQSYSFQVKASDGINMSTTSDVTVKLLSENGVRQERWNDIPGGAIADFLNHAHYQDTADETKIVTALDMNENLKSNFGQIMTTTFRPEESGEYVFAIVGDDATELRLDGQKIAYTTWWTSYQNWSAAGKSDVTKLIAGNIYKLEAFLKEGGGGEHVSVGLRKVSDTDFALIPKTQLFLNLLDAENVKPIFTNLEYNATIDKWQNKTQTIFHVTSNDSQGDVLSYSIKENVPFRVDANGDIFVNDVLNVGSYDFTLMLSDSTNVVEQSMHIDIQANTIVKTPYRANDNRPQLSGFLPNIYKEGDTVSVLVNGKSYIANVNNGMWQLDDDVITPALEIGVYDVNVTVGTTSIDYANYFEVYGERMQTSKHTLAMNTIADVAVTVNSSLVTPLVKNEKVRGTSIKLYVENGVTKLQNKSYRKIASLLGKYTDENGESVFVKLNFSENIMPYSDNNLSTFAHDSEMSIVTTANHYNGQYSFGERGGDDCSVSTSDTSSYCTPTTVNDAIYSDTAVQNPELSEQQSYSILLATYNHFFNSIDGIKAMKAWVYKETYKNMDFSDPYQGIDGYIGDEDRNAYLYRNFSNFTLPERHIMMRTMRYHYTAAGLGGSWGPVPLLGSQSALGFAALWEGAMALSVDDYDIVLHEIGHASDYSHESGMTYGWPYAFRKVAETLYTVGESPVVNVPKYIFETQKISNTQTKIIVHKTTEASEDEVNFELLSSEPLVGDDFVLSPGAEDNSVMLTSNGRVIFTRIFIRAYGDDSRELMSKALRPEAFMQTYLLTDTNTSKEYHAITHENWVKVASDFNKTLKPENAGHVCRTILGAYAKVPYQAERDKLHTDYPNLVDSADWLVSKKLLGHAETWWQYKAYDYSDGGYTKEWKGYKTLVDDDTLGILCSKPIE